MDTLDKYERMDMCQDVAHQEGTELGDAISAGVSYCRALLSLGDDEEFTHVLKHVEQMCTDFLDSAEDEYIENISNDTYKHFTNRDKPEPEFRLKSGHSYLYENTGGHIEIVTYHWLEKDGCARCTALGKTWADKNNIIVINKDDLKPIDIKNIKL